MQRSPRDNKKIRGRTASHEHLGPVTHRSPASRPKHPEGYGRKQPVPHPALNDLVSPARKKTQAPAGPGDGKGPYAHGTHLTAKKNLPARQGQNLSPRTKRGGLTVPREELDKALDRVNALRDQGYLTPERAASLKAKLLYGLPLTPRRPHKDPAHAPPAEAADRDRCPEEHAAAQLPGQGADARRARARPPRRSRPHARAHAPPGWAVYEPAQADLEPQ
jgi:hypothetical protein